MRKLTVKGRYLAWEDGEPFFYLGDTAWEIFHRLSREEMEHYFAQRARQGYTVVQGVALAEFEGLTVPNAYGRLPLCLTDGLPDPTRPDTQGEYSYWDHVDFAVETAAKNGLFIALLPTWGDKFNLCWGKGPVVFDEDNAYLYGKWIAARYGDRENILWMLGGDRRLEPEHRRIIDAMARGIREMDANHLITFHPPGCANSTDFLADADYIDFHTSQTGHSVDQCYETDAVMLRMAAASPKPYMDSEPRYEDHPACFNDKLGLFWNADDMRQNAYWNLMAGVCGHTYGNHCIWSMTKSPSSYYPFHWSVALQHPGAEQVRHIKALRLSHDYFSFRPAPELFVEQYAGMGHLAAGRGLDYGYVYSPLGLPFTVNLGQFTGSDKLRAKWFDPRTGKAEIFAIFPAKGQSVVVPPTQGKGCDWVLILEEV